MVEPVLAPRKAIAVAGMLVLAISAAFAQQPPPKQGEIDSQHSKIQNPKSKIRLRFDLGAGWSNWGLSGNQNKFREYATAPRGFFVKQLNLGLSDDLSNDARITLKGPGESDYRYTGVVKLNAGTTKIIATDFANRFFDPNPTVTNPSGRHVSEGMVIQKLSQDFALSFRTRLTSQNQTIAEPGQTLKQDTRISNVAARGSPWRNGFVDVSFTDTRYDDLTAILPATHTQSVSAGLMQQIGDTLALSGSYSRSLIQQPAGPTNKIDEWNLGGNWIAGDDTNILVNYRNEHLNLPTVLQASDRSRQELRTRVVHRCGSGWNLQFGYDQLALERYRDDHTFVDVPRLHTFDAQLSGNLSRSTRITANISHQAMQGGAQMQIVDPRGLYWTAKLDSRVKIDTHYKKANGYLVFDWHENHNSPRDVSVFHQGLTLGADWDVKPNVELYAEVSNDLWSGHTSDPLSPDINAFFPDASTMTLGANWTVNDKTWATANYTFYKSANSNPLNLPGASVTGNYFTGTVHYKAGKDCEFGLTVAPWHFVDQAAAAMGYTTGLIQITARRRF